ncbi:MAG: M1 family aminopeptidase [Candidatus Krumholzibacteriia bacterium]
MTRPFLLVPMLAAAAVALAAPPPVITHQAALTFDVDAHRVTVVDAVDVQGADGPVVLDRACLDKSLTSELAGETHPVEIAAPLRYGFTAHQPTDQVKFSRENVGGEITATVGPEGIYLAGDTAWLPTVDGALHAGRFTIDLPAGWYPVMSGHLVSQEAAGDRHRFTYEITAPVDGLSFVANTYAVTEREHAGVVMRTCLLAADERLSETYLERTAHYLDLYSGMIGPYPYTDFTTVENWFPTGYGMPGWTLLGSEVIRLPFIPYTSFGHEIAHNWWGNSVFVDAEGGNWCEGLTVFCADYEYKREEGPDAAREYRRNQLKDYAAYVGGHPERDFPLREFKARHSGATRAVGYGKSMAVWHMLEVELGRDAVLASLQRVYRDFRGRPAAWGDFFAALEAESGRDLAGFQAQWIDLAGAPTISLGEVSATRSSVTFTLHQEGDPYQLTVPVVIDTHNGPVREVVRFDQPAQTFHVNARAARSVDVDPDYDVFRHLHPGEIEPTLSTVLAADHWVFTEPVDDLELDALARDFARAFCECDEPEFTADGRPRRGAVNIVINPAPDVLAAYTPAELSFAGPSFVLAGRTYDVGDHDLVFAARAPGGGTDLVVSVSDPDRLPGLGRRLPHYGKYSWLVLPADGGRPERGNWTPDPGPMQAAVAP